MKGCNWNMNCKVPLPDCALIPLFSHYTILFFKPNHRSSTSMYPGSCLLWVQYYLPHTDFLSTAYFEGTSPCFQSLPLVSAVRKSPISQSSSILYITNHQNNYQYIINSPICHQFISTFSPHLTTNRMVLLLTLYFFPVSTLSWADVTINSRGRIGESRERIVTLLLTLSASYRT